MSRTRSTSGDPHRDRPAAADSSTRMFRRSYNVRMADGLEGWTGTAAPPPPPPVAPAAAPRATRSASDGPPTLPSDRRPWSAAMTSGGTETGMAVEAVVEGRDAGSEAASDRTRSTSIDPHRDMPAAAEASTRALRLSYKELAPDDGGVTVETADRVADAACATATAPALTPMATRSANDRLPSALIP